MRVAADSTNVSVMVRIVDSADGTPETGVTSATGGLALGYWREGAASFVGLTESDLATLDAAHSDGGMLHINSGHYRVDVPDAAFATGADRVLIGGEATDMVVIGQVVEIGPVVANTVQVEGVDATDQINAAADTAISDAALATAAALATVDGNVDTILLDTNELQTDLADGGRLDLLIDQIITDIGALDDVTIAEILAMTVEGGITFVQAQRIMLAAQVGKSTGGGTTSVDFRDQADTKSRVQATVDANGNRTAVTLDGA